MAFVMLSAHADISIGTTGSWVDTDVSSYVPSGAKGVYIYFESSSSSIQTYGARKNGSSDTSTKSIGSDCMRIYAVGLDSSRIFEQYISNTKVDCFLVGYWDNAAGTTFFDNFKIIYGVADGGNFIDVDCSGISEGGDVAKFLYTDRIPASGPTVYWRVNGSTDSIVTGIFFTVLALDGSEIVEIKTTNLETTPIFHVYGYSTGGTVLLNKTFEGSTTAATWTNMLSGESGGAQVLCILSVGCAEIAARPYGSSIDIISEIACGGTIWPGSMLTPKGGGEVYQVYTDVAIGIYSNGIIADPTGQEPITITKMMLDHVGKSLFAKETIHPALRALDWVGQGLSAGYTVQAGKVDLNWDGKGSKLTETIHPTLLALDWSGKTLLAHEKIVPALRALNWDGKDVTALVALLIQYADIGWSGKPLLANELIRPTKRALDWLGGALAADEKIVLGARTLDWAGEAAWAKETLSPGAVALDWAGTTPLAHEQITAALRALDWAGQEVMTTSGLIVEHAILQWTGRNLAADETIEVGKKGADWAGLTPLASELLRVGILPTDWTGKGVNIGYTFLIAVVELDWLGRNVVDVALIRKKLRIIGTGYKRLIGG